MLECVTEEQAVRSLEGNFAPWLDGDQLLKYYEERVLTEAQMRAMVAASNEIALAVPQQRRIALLMSGEMDSDCPPHEELIAAAVKVHPDCEALPEGELLERLRKKAKTSKKSQPPDFRFARGYLHDGDTCTWVHRSTVEACWRWQVRLAGRKSAIKSLAKQVLEGLGRS